MVSPAQTKVRNAFKDCVDCFALQPEEGGVEPPAEGPRNRSWWYDQAGGTWYYNYFIQQSWATFFAGNTPDWCKKRIDGFTGGKSFGIGDEGQDYIEDGIDLPAGWTDSRYWLTDAYYRGCLMFDVTQVSSEDLENFAHAYVYVYIEHDSDNPFVLSFYDWLTGGTKPPNQMSDLSFSGSVLHAYPYTGGDEWTHFDIKNTLLYHKANALTTCYIPFRGSIEQAPPSSADCTVKGPNATGEECYLSLQ